LPAEHAFAAEHAGKAHAIEAADQRALALRVHRPGLDRMGMAHGMQRAVAVADALRNPAILRPGARRGARSITASNAALQVTTKRPRRSVRASECEQWNPSSGRIARRRGSTQ
jgi:hypothetical protein